MLKSMRDEDTAAHRELASKITALEKWRWMLIGAGFVLGGLGYSGIESMMVHG